MGLRYHIYDNAVRLTAVLTMAAYMSVIEAQVRPARSDDGTESQNRERDNAQSDFGIGIGRQLATMKTAPRERKFDLLPDAAAVVAILESRTACKMFVGGKYGEFIFSRLRYTTYLEYWIVAARKLPDGRVQALFGLAAVEPRVVGLFQPYFRPKAAWVSFFKRPRPTENLLPHMERALGFKAGSLTPTIVRVLTILHEQAHLNEAIPADDLCMRRSMLNTRRIAEVCYPEIVQPLMLTAEVWGGACP